MTLLVISPVKIKLNGVITAHQPGEVIELPDEKGAKLLAAGVAKETKPVEQQTPAEFERSNQIVVWRTGSGRTIFIAPSWAVEKYRQPGQAWFTPWEIVELRALQLDADTIERISDMKELMGAQISGTC